MHTRSHRNPLIARSGCLVVGSDVETLSEDSLGLKVRSSYFSLEFSKTPVEVANVISESLTGEAMKGNYVASLPFPSEYTCEKVLNLYVSSQQALMIFILLD